MQGQKHWKLGGWYSRGITVHYQRYFVRFFHIKRHKFRCKASVKSNIILLHVQCSFQVASNTTMMMMSTTHKPHHSTREPSEHGSLSFFYDHTSVSLHMNEVVFCSVFNQKQPCEKLQIIFHFFLFPIGYG